MLNKLFKHSPNAMNNGLDKFNTFNGNITEVNLGAGRRTRWKISVWGALADS